MAGDFKLSNIGVIMLGTSAPDASVAFYRDTLGLDLTGLHGGFAFFDGGGVSLVLSPELASAGENAPKTAEVVFSVAHVREAYEALKAKGVEFRVEPRAVTGPMWATDFRDPDGHVLSLFGPE